MPHTTATDHALTDEQKQFWLEHGYLKIPQCFTRAASDAFTSSLWPRLGMSLTDKSTWTAEKLNMPGHTTVSAKAFAPKAWAAMCELVGGEARIADWCKDWRDSFIPNFGRPEYRADDELDFRRLGDWHNDGDFFVHFLDSPEQALLIIPLFSDIQPKGGGTALCTDGIGLVAKRLVSRPSSSPCTWLPLTRLSRQYDHPDGMTPFLTPRDSPDIPKSDPARRKVWRDWAADPTQTRDESFTEATGETGDVYILHPFMLHAASQNLRRDVRIITNPPVALKEPFEYHRSDPAEFSLVEQKTLRELGRPEGLPEWRITRERERIVPDRVRVSDESLQMEAGFVVLTCKQMQKEMKEKEVERLNAGNVAANGLEGAKAQEFYYPA